MSKVISIVMLAAFSAANAENLFCAEDLNTHRTLCFPVQKVRSNGQVRAAPYFQGAPNTAAHDTGQIAIAHCGSSELELADRKGVPFARRVPKEQVGKDLVRYLCSHSPTINDPKLATY